MPKFHEIPIMGTFAYKAEELIDSGQLKHGDFVSLEHEPENSYDSNAVSVKIKGKKIGYIPKNIAEAICNQDFSKFNIKVQNAGKNKDNVYVIVKIPDNFFPKNTVYKNLNQRISDSLGIAGIYVIRNSLNSMEYIGQSCDIGKRWKDHVDDLKKNSHPSKKLLKAFWQYGIDVFEFEILERCSEELDRLDLEKHYILQI